MAIFLGPFRLCEGTSQKVLIEEKCRQIQLCLDVVGLDCAPVVELLGVEVIDDVPNNADVLGLFLEFSHQADGGRFWVKLVQAVASRAGEVDAIVVRHSAVEADVFGKVPAAHFLPGTVLIHKDRLFLYDVQSVPVEAG